MGFSCEERVYNFIGQTNRSIKMVRPVKARRILIFSAHNPGTIRVSTGNSKARNLKVAVI
jgi:hypothetical protein